MARSSSRGLGARRNSLGKPGLDFFLHPSHRPPAQAHRPGKCALRDAQINRAARQAGARLYGGKSQYRVRHHYPSLRESGSDETQGSCAIWAINRETQRAAAHILWNKSTAWLVRGSPPSGGGRGSTYRKHQRKQMDSWTKVGRKKSAQLFSLLHVFADGVGASTGGDVLLGN